ncbi:MAG: aromatic ring-hydroxylating dioxygenase subunit alpha [Gammaproteobacteria bacterium]|nr:aromatic ring-hydroxylating dioxygenase subunit alpha [Gammaproteobacteria bacterium]NNF49741.1 aromatic ring-hydroxylating dioxygenase subunit alpha [Woeseiaceae bacterium]MBT8094145.1 aromatic ring-hydroxylating dioxygenase subunit alpha [Gammaproteobacteria bacterium]MBT8106540.1 aromatic ring-hydroxylating dioxygenase subunit alpha [Gammaproteobacteria bacterium]NNK26555.1 aromatic ring-hydroxylating dioxygenase subunit alpha [Woeseiaceae bacterium]
MSDRRRQLLDELLAARRPGHALAQAFYTDPAIYELELERIVYRNWVLAGHVSELPDSGDFKVLEVARESAIIVRGEDGELRAFANVCRHRGSLVCLENRGTTKKFTCPYHGWMYGLDGRLTAARDMPEEFDRDAHGLKPLSFDVVHGLMFVAFTTDPPSLDGCKRDLAEPMAMFDFPGLRVAANRTYDIPANWKLCIENYQECYHCATAHPEYARMHSLTLNYERRARMREELKERMPVCGVREYDVDYIDTAARPGEIGYGYSRSSLFGKYFTGSRDGRPVAPLLGEFTGYDQGASDFTFGAFSFLLAYSDHVVAYVFTPLEHQLSRCEIYWLVRGDAREGRDYDVDELTWLWDVTTRADKEIIVNNSKGVHSKYYEPGPFSTMEAMESIYVDWILQELQRE